MAHTVDPIANAADREILSVWFIPYVEVCMRLLRRMARISIK